VNLQGQFFQKYWPKPFFFLHSEVGKLQTYGENNEKTEFCCCIVLEPPCVETPCHCEHKVTELVEVVRGNLFLAVLYRLRR
jgi:hypothetical protein